jgi:hypothetical protein
MYGHDAWRERSPEEDTCASEFRERQAEKEDEALDQSIWEMLNGRGSQFNFISLYGLSENDEASLREHIANLVRGKR